MMPGLGRRPRRVALGAVVTATAAAVSVGARALPPDVRWAVLVVATPYLLGGLLLVTLPLVAWIGGTFARSVDPVSRG